jgi:hypothetical protein
MAMADETLLLLASEVRGKTLRILDGVTSDDEARFTGPGLNNSVLWHAGHSIMVVEHLGLMAATGRPAAYPSGWFEKFGWKTEPAKVKDWPALAEVKEQLRSQLTRLQDAIRSLSPAQLDAIVDQEKNRTVRYSILHGLHDEAGHQGEMYLLRKLYARRAAAVSSTGS